MKKRILALCLSLCMLFSTAVVASGAMTAEGKADALYSMGLFKGKGTLENGSPDYALDDSATRNEAATMLIRLLGKEAKAAAQYQAGAMKCPFGDVPDWAKGNVTWLYENNYTNGTSSSVYSGSSEITAQQFAALLLRSLGYSETKGDFTYAGALDFAVSKGLLTNGQKTAYQDSFVREGMVEMCYNALYLKMKDSSRTLEEKLRNDGVFGAQHTALAGTPSLRLTQKYAGGGSDSRYYAQEATVCAPAAVDLDGNGSLELLFSARSVFCLDAKSGKTLWRVNSGYDRSGSGEDFGRATLSLQVADVDGDGQKEIVTVHTNYGSGTSCVAVYSHQGYFEKGWPVHTPKPVRAMTISDLDGNGTQEICLGLGVGAGKIPSIYVYESNGSLRSGWPQVCGYGLFSNSIAAADMDQDGSKELVVLFDQEQIAAYHNDGTPVIATGGVYRGLPWNGLPGCEDNQYEIDCANYARSHNGVCFASADNMLGSTRERKNCIMGTNGGVAAADMDGNGTTELVFSVMVVDGSMIMRGAETFDLSVRYFTPFILNMDRTRYTNAGKGYDWTEMPTDPAEVVTMKTNTIPATDMSPVVADLDRDGTKEIIYTSNDGQVHCWSLDKTQHGAWPYDLNSRSSSGVTFASKPTAADVNGDGKLEVLFTTYKENNQTAQRGSLYVLDYTGKVLAKVTLPVRWGATADNANQPNGSMASPCVADLDGDGKAEIAVTSLYSGIIVYDVG